MNTPSSLSSSHNMKSITNHTINERRILGKLEYESWLFRGQVLWVLQTSRRNRPRRKCFSQKPSLRVVAILLLMIKTQSLGKLQDSDDSDEDSDEELTLPATYENYVRKKSRFWWRLPLFHQWRHSQVEYETVYESTQWLQDVQYREAITAIKI